METSGQETKIRLLALLKAWFMTILAFIVVGSIYSIMGWLKYGVWMTPGQVIGRIPIMDDYIAKLLAVMAPWMIVTSCAIFWLAIGTKRRVKAIKYANRQKTGMMKTVFYIHTNGYDMLVSVTPYGHCRYLTDNGTFPDILSLDDSTREQKALEFLNGIEDDSTWTDAGIIEDVGAWLDFDGRLGDPSEIVAKIDRVL